MNRVRRLFWNDRQGRLRALWRILIVLVGTLALVALASQPLTGRLEEPWLSVAMQLSSLVVVLAVLAVAARWLDRRSVLEYGFRVDRDWWLDLAAGAVIGLLVTGGTFAAGLVLGWIAVEDVLVPGPASLGVGLATGLFAFAVVGFWEETVFRGVVLKNAAEGATAYVSRPRAVVVALVATAAVFGLLHFGQASGLALGYWILVGLLLGLAYVLTGELALPIGLHVTYNFGFNHVFGFGPVLAEQEAATLLRPDLVAPDLLVGLAGLLHVAFALVGFALVLGWIRWRRGSIELDATIADPPRADRPEPARSEQSDSGTALERDG